MGTLSARCFSFINLDPPATSHRGHGPPASTEGRSIAVQDFTSQFHFGHLAEGFEDGFFSL